MSDKCDISQENVDLLNEADNLREQESKKNTKVVSSGVENEIKMRNYLREKYSKGDIISESQLNQIFNELYGKKSDRIKLSNKINGLMEANESLKSYMNIYIAENLPPKVKITEDRIFEEMKFLIKEFRLNFLYISSETLLIIKIDKLMKLLMFLLMEGF